MADQASQTTVIAASPERCFDVALAFEQYPQWAKDIDEATVVRRDDQGRALEVEFRASAIGRSTHYTLAYDYSHAPSVLSWSLVRGDITKAIDGSYTFTDLGDGRCEVTYDLSIELVVPLPGFVKRRAEVRILNTLREFAARAES
jgi:ribosome-associated toxin RatA of RatAB toxin-antitoxin module